MKTKFYLIVLLIFAFAKTNAQWLQTGGPGGGDVRCFAVNGSTVCAGTDYGGVYLSTNNGSSWSGISNGLTNAAIRSLAISGSNIFAGTYNGGAFLSTNNGTSWTAVNNGLTNAFVNALIINGTNIFAGTNGGVFLSTNNGTSWAAMALSLAASDSAR